MVSNIIGNIIFSSIGFVAFIYGKKMAQYRTMFLGLALMVFPYFFSSNWALYGIGAALTAALWFWRE